MPALTIVERELDRIVSRERNGRDHVAVIRNLDAMGAVQCLSVKI